MKPFNLGKIIGLKIIAIKGYPKFGYSGEIKPTPKGKEIEPVFILFSDRITFIRLDAQNSYIYHDCDGSARIIEIQQDADVWSQIINYPDATRDL